MRSRRAALIAVGLMTVPAAHASGQALTGVVRHDGTGEPLAGVLVSVLDFEGTRVRGVLSDGSGGYRVEVPMGRYTLQAERIGLRTTEIADVELATLTDHFVEIRMAERAVEIAGLVVDSRVQSCRIDREEADEIQRWWQEIRTALGISAALSREEFGVFRVERMERQWDEGLDRLIASNSRVSASESSRAFVAEDVDFLLDGGFVQGAVAGQRQYYGPDADVLLSTQFLSQHCFSLDDDRNRPDQLGLAFEPIEGREVVDIEGTLWVDTTTTELQDLVFQFEDEPDVEDNEGGGRIVFDYLPGGAWIISDWFIRMPVLGARLPRRGGDYPVVGYVEVGGAITPIEVAEVDGSGAVGRIEGSVFDSIRGVGLPDATVGILGTDRRVTTDAAGQFVLDSVPVGRHNLSFAHEETDAWGLGASFVEVDVTEGRTSGARLGTPTFQGAALSLCLGNGRDAVTVLIGRVLDPARQPWPQLPVRLEWQPPPAAGPEPRSMLLQTDSDGRFVACTIPSLRPITVHVARGAEWSEVMTIVSPVGLVTYREIWFTRWGRLTPGAR